MRSSRRLSKLLIELALFLPAFFLLLLLPTQPFVHGDFFLVRVVGIVDIAMSHRLVYGWL